MKHNIFTIFALTSTVAALADWWSLVVCAGVGVGIAIFTFHEFILKNLPRSIVILVIGLVAQYFIQSVFGVTFLVERVGFMLTPVAYIFILKYTLESKIRILIEHRVRMWT